MKVFTVGMEEKPPLKDTPTVPDGVTMTSAPVITLERKRNPYKSYMMCLGTLLLILLFAIIVSEMAYNRARDENYLRLRWAELKHRMGMGCDDCLNSRIAQTYYPQRFQGAPIVLENSNEATASETSVQSLAIEQSTSTASTSQPSDVQSSLGLSQSVDSRLDFLRKIIPKIKEQAEKSGIEGVMHVKVLQIDPVESKQLKPTSLLDGFGEVQSQPVVNGPQPVDFLTSRALFGNSLADLLSWKPADSDESRSLGNTIVGSQNDMVMGEPLLIMGPFIQAQQQLQPLSGIWDNNNAAWNSPSQIRPFGWTQQIPKQQQWNQWTNSASNNNQNVPYWSSNQWMSSQSHPISVVQQQTSLSARQLDNQWQNNGQISGSWGNDVQNSATWQNGVQQSSASNQWPQHGWQGQQQQQHWAQYPQTWQASMNQNQDQKINDWNIQRVTDSDHSASTTTSSFSALDSIRKVFGMIMANRLSHLFQQKLLHQGLNQSVGRGTAHDYPAINYSQSLPTKTNIVDNLDGRMNQAVLRGDSFSSNNNYNYNYNGNANDQWMRYYNQWYTNNQRFQQQQQQPIVTAAVSQPLEVIGPQVPSVAAEQSHEPQEQQQPQLIETQHQKESEQQQVQVMPNHSQEQQQQPQPSMQVHDQPIQPQSSAEMNADAMPDPSFKQSPVVPEAPNNPDENVKLGTEAPFVFDNDDWKKVDSSSVLTEPVEKQQEHQPQLSIHPIDGRSDDISTGMKVIDSVPLKVPILEDELQQSKPTSEGKNEMPSPILFQVDEPLQQSVSVEESFSK